MAYGDNLIIDGVTHLENHEGDPICGASGFYLNGVICRSCQLRAEHDRDLLDRWNTGKGIEGSKPIEDKLVWDGSNPQPSIHDKPPKKVPGLGAWKSDGELLGLDIRPKRKGW